MLTYNSRNHSHNYTHSSVAVYDENEVSFQWVYQSTVLVLLYCVMFVVETDYS